MFFGAYVSGLESLTIPVIIGVIGNSAKTNATTIAITIGLIGFFRCLLRVSCQISIGAKIIAVNIQKILKKLGKNGMANIKSMSVKIQNSVV